jgi:hypothetical protein
VSPRDGLGHGEHRHSREMSVLHSSDQQTFRERQSSIPILRRLNGMNNKTIETANRDSEEQVVFTTREFKGLCTALWCSVFDEKDGDDARKAHIESCIDCASELKLLRNDCDDWDALAKKVWSLSPSQTNDLIRQVMHHLRLGHDGIRVEPKRRKAK